MSCSEGVHATQWPQRARASMIPRYELRQRPALMARGMLASGPHGPRVTLEFLIWSCVKRHFDPGILEQWEGFESGIFDRKLTVQKNAHRYQVFAMSGTDRVIDATDRSSEHEGSDLEA